ncbi:hypothetical protein RG47T_3722 [Mucilaginibacter polytrichastri]|uniref:Uncharacterized protein n=1 Tax=Mucilaginibacter polytrichastri TaxID=1302689 RepID=A0A1Q6A2L5_9SPHI|nr:hypothetical protein RG47T_3722 [Mucilaginibacter polytrichastri]SFT27641.1 hypothetical protein SAMN04487890_13210 [Mucilaginibacter polytrichastri]
MKIINTEKPVSVDEIERLFNEKLNPLFHDQRQIDMSLLL